MTREDCLERATVCWLLDMPDTAVIWLELARGTFVVADVSEPDLGGEG